MGFKLISQADYSRLTGISRKTIASRIKNKHYANCTRRHKDSKALMLYKDRALYVDGLAKRPACNVWLRQPAEAAIETQPQQADVDLDDNIPALDFDFDLDFDIDADKIEADLLAGLPELEAYLSGA